MKFSAEHSKIRSIQPTCQLEGRLWMLMGKCTQHIQMSYNNKINSCENGKIYTVETRF